MSLNKIRLKNNIKTAFEMMQQGNGNATATLEILCDNIAGAIIDEIKEADVIYTTGLTNAAGAVTGTFIHTIE